MVGGVGPLSHHVVSAVSIRWLAHRRTHWRPGLVPRRVVHVLRSDLRTALLRRHVVIVGTLRWRHGRHAITWYKGLRLGIEGVSVEAARDGVLALRVVGVNVDGK